MLALPSTKDFLDYTFIDLPVMLSSQRNTRFRRPLPQFA